MLGREPDELGPRSLTAQGLVHPDDVGAGLLALEALRSGARDHVELERRIRHRDGHWVWVAVRCSIVARDAAGRPARLSGTITDISEAKATALRVEASEHELAAYFESPAVGVAVLRGGRITRVNGCLAALLGDTRGALVGRAWTDLCPADDRAAVAEALRELELGEAGARSLDQRLALADGGARWVLASFSGVRDAGDGAATCLAIVVDISERKAAEAALREREAQLRATEAQLARVLAGSRDGYIDGNVVTGETYRSPALARMLGYDHISSSPDVFGALVHPEDRPRLLAAVQAVRDGKADGYDGQHRLRHADGRWVWVAARCSVVERDASGRATRIAGALRDVTQERLAAQRVVQSERELAAYFETPAVGIAVTGPDRRFVRVNEQFAAMLGYTREELVGRSFAEVTYADDLDLHREPSAKLEAGEVPSFSVDKRYVRRDGSVLWSLTSVSLVRDADRKVAHWVAVIVDISARKAAEAALREREARLAAYLNTPAMGVIIAVGGTTCSEVNDAACAILGYSREELLQLEWSDFSHPEDLPGDIAQYERLARGEIESYALDKRYVRKDGSSVWCLLSVSCVRRADGTIEQAIGIIKDITARKAAERELRLREAELSAYFQSPAVGIAVSDIDGRWQEVNDGLCAMLGFARDELIGRPAKDLMHPEDRDAQTSAARAWAVGSTGGLTRDERYVRKDGSVLWATVTVSGIRGESGRVMKRIETLTDITAAHEAADRIGVALAENQRLVRELQVALENVKTLSGLLPICASCKKIRDDHGHWDWLEHYISKRTDAVFSHGLCPDCLKAIDPTITDADIDP